MNSAEAIVDCKGGGKTGQKPCNKAQARNRAGGKDLTTSQILYCGNTSGCSIFSVLNTAVHKNIKLCGDLITRAKHPQPWVPSNVVIRDSDKATSFQRTFLTTYLCITPCSLLICAAPR